MDELVSFLVQRYGKASAGGVLGYSLDNEPDLWSSTHALIHPNACGAAELVQRSSELATAVKAVDSSAEIFGLVSYGYAGYVSLQDAADWESVQGSYDWYVQYFLAQMAAASNQAGTRLLDVLDLHYYSEARGNDTRIQEGTTTNAGARVQSTRSLWDPNYGYSETDPTAGENSWITEWNDPIQLIPRVQGYIHDLYPDTKLALTEYDFGAANHVSGGIAQADALGVYGREGVYFATRWGDPGTFTDAAFKLYLDYDGQGSRFGNISVKAATSDVVNVPAYAALDEANPGILHVILINRNLTATQAAAVTIGGTSTYGSGQAWGFDSASATLSSKGQVVVSGNSFSMSLPALSATHVVLNTSDPPPITGVGGASSTGGTGASNGGSNAAGGTAATIAGSSSAGSDPAKKDDGGCGCRLSTPGSSARGAIALLGALLLCVRRRR
jgi:mannan endo-1,4-beta-mannosidase